MLTTAIWSRGTQSTSSSVLRQVVSSRALRRVRGLCASSPGQEPSSFRPGTRYVAPPLDSLFCSVLTVTTESFQWVYDRTASGCVRSAGFSSGRRKRRLFHDGCVVGLRWRSFMFSLTGSCPSGCLPCWLLDNQWKWIFLELQNLLSSSCPKIDLVHMAPHAAHPRGPICTPASLGPDPQHRDPILTLFTSTPGPSPPSPWRSCF